MATMKYFYVNSALGLYVRDAIKQIESEVGQC